LKRGIGVINAFIVMLLITTLILIIIKLSFISIKYKNNVYLQQKGVLFMKSAIENTILAIEGYKRDNKCLKHITFKDEKNRFIAKIDILRYYCYYLNDCPCDNVKKISTNKSHGYVLLKVIVKSNLSNLKNGNKKIRLEKITLQRP